jgi:hypothetical protein
MAANTSVTRHFLSRRRNFVASSVNEQEGVKLRCNPGRDRSNSHIVVFSKITLLLWHQSKV